MRRELTAFVSGERVPDLSAQEAAPATAVTPRWLFVDNALGFGGHEVMLLRLLEELAEQRRVTPLLLAPSGSRLRTQGARFAVDQALVPERGAGLRALPSALRDFRALAQVVRRLRPSLCIVAEGTILAQPTSTAAARTLGVPLAIYTPLVERAADMGFGKGRLRDFLVRHGYANFPDAWITITEQQARVFRGWAGVRRPIFTLPNTIARSTERAASHGAQRRARSQSGSRERAQLLVLGRFDAHQKGLDLLLAHLSDAPELVEQLQLTLAGEGPYRRELERRIARSELLARMVRLEPWSDAQALLSRADVLLLPSRYEGVPLVMLEAMALGVPVAASDLPGTRAHLPESCLFPVGDMRRAFEIALGLRDVARAERVRAHNVRRFSEQASGAAFARAVQALTHQLLAIGASR